MKKIANNSSMGIALLIALALMYVNIPLMDEKSIAAIIMLIVGIILLVQK